MGPQSYSNYNIRCTNGHYSTTRFPLDMTSILEGHSYPEMVSEKVYTLKDLW